MSDLKEVKILDHDDSVQEQLRAQDIFGFPFFRTVTSIAALPAPRNAFEQVVILFSGGIHQLVIYDMTTATWRFVQIT